MKLLLDTHIWVWMHIEPEKLHRRILTAVKKADTELWLSPFSVWEVLLLAGAGKLDIAEDRFSWVAKALTSIPVREAPITLAVVLASERLELPHRDPADRFIAASARIHGLTLVTADRRLLAAKGLAVLSNR